jgi:hypothetical protein
MAEGGSGDPLVRLRRPSSREPLTRDVIFIMDDVKEYEVVDVDIAEVFHCADWRNFTQRLRRRGFVRSSGGEAYYNPRHWLEWQPKSRKTVGTSDYWIDIDEFWAVSDDARRWLKSLKEQDEVIAKSRD